MKKFQKYHLLQILELFDDTTLPLDVFLNKYFRAHKAIGSKDRKVVCESLYLLIRWRGLFDHFLQKPFSWADRLELVPSLDKLKLDPGLPAHKRVSFPKDLYQRLEETFGADNAPKICLICNTQAPITIRANAMKTERRSLLGSFSQQFNVYPCKHSDQGITFSERTNLFLLPEFKKGLFEVQDEGSQLVAEKLDVKPGDRVMDYCAGSGGKTLAFAHKMQGKGVIYLHDIRPYALVQARKRLKRAGIQNAQFVMGRALRKLKGKMHWILLDVPCSGTGTLRRNPDMKWKITDELVSRIVKEQREIFEKSLAYLAPGGRIVYATCSMLPAENEEQIEYFVNKYEMRVENTPLSTLPQEGGMDGFFAAVLVPNSK